jgi:hypothetical protein
MKGDNDPTTWYKDSLRFTKHQAQHNTKAPGKTNKQAYIDVHIYTNKYSIYLAIYRHVP